MAFLEYHLWSDALEMMTTVSVLLPKAEFLKGKPLQTLYLLHGYSDDHTAWMRKSRIEDYAAKYRLCVVMPEVAHSFYTDIPGMEQYFTFVSKELPEIMERTFPLRRDRGGRFVAGLSMGGYGAFHVGLGCPKRFAGAASLSGVLTAEDRFTQDQKRMELWNLIFQSAQSMKKHGNDLSHLASKLTRETAPKLYMACGEQDGLLGMNETFFARFGEKLGIRYDKEPGIHEWAFWDKHIQDVLDYFPIEKIEQ